ncbi:type II toxin-antitoxin system HicB family antitoxin [Methanoplanus endosymbiosus]|uniref:type II toxin-antitoxin system HicB family antitoxin n=1 Tax=Methanoplanus endosymbiosus TaxID=33865 RepID=UPI0035625624
MSYNHLRYTVMMEKNEDGGYTVTVPSLPGCISEGSDWDAGPGKYREGHCRLY